MSNNIHPGQIGNNSHNTNHGRNDTAHHHGDDQQASLATDVASVAYALVDADSENAAIPTTAIPTITELTTPSQWYEYYAIRYPSIGHLELLQLQEEEHRRIQEEKERELLLRGERSGGGQQSGGGGWFRRLFFGGGTNSSTATGVGGVGENIATNASKEDDTTDIGVGSLEKNEEDKAHNEEEELFKLQRFLRTQHPNNAHTNHGNGYSRDGMCGTTSLLDPEAITHEALAFHRFHLASERRATCAPLSGNGGVGAAGESSGWNVALPIRKNIGWESMERDIQRSIPHFCIVGYGQIAEIPRFESASNDDNATNADEILEERKERETQRLQSGQNAYDATTVTLTSDWKALSALGMNSHKQSKSTINNTSEEAPPPPPPHDIRHVRAASIGPDCLIVSWGRGDGWIVFYRRVGHGIADSKKQQKSSRKNAKNPNDSSTLNEKMLTIGWEAVAAASPSEAVINVALKEMTPATPSPDSTQSHDENNVDEVDEETLGRMTQKQRNQYMQRMQQQHQLKVGRLYESGSVRVTDLVPMVIDQQQAQPSVVLAISRLGGYVELLPLPTWIWLPHPPHHGNETTHNPSNPSSRSTSSNPSNFIPNLTATAKITAFATTQYHIDIMAMDAHRTSVGTTSGVNGGQCQWDPERNPEGPPSEIVLAVGGRSSGSAGAAEGRESWESKVSITLWGVTTIYGNAQRDESQQQQHLQQQQEDIPLFDIHVQYLGNLNLDNVGANASVFISETTAKHWIRSIQPLTHPTQFKQRPNDTIKRLKSIQRYQNLFPSSVTTTAPVVSLRFTPKSHGLQSGVGGVGGVLLAAMDYNGGISIIDCTQTIRWAEHYLITNNSRTMQELVIKPEISELYNRNQMMRVLSPKGNKGNSGKKGNKGREVGIASATQMEWWLSSSTVHDAGASGGGGNDGNPYNHQSLIDPSSLGTFVLATTCSIMPTIQVLPHRKKGQQGQSRMKNVIRLQQWTVLSNESNGFEDGLPAPNDIVRIPIHSAKMNGSETTMLLPMPCSIEVTDMETLSFLRLGPTPASLTTNNATNINNICNGLHQLALRKYTDPTQIITTLLRQSNPAKALEVARKFGGAQHFGGRVMNECRMQLWEDHGDVGALRLVSDDEYVISAALELDGIGSSTAIGEGGLGSESARLQGLGLDSLCEIYKEALIRCDRLTHSDNIHNLSIDPDWLTSTASRLRNAIRRLGTFELLTRQFTQGQSGQSGQQPSAEMLLKRFLLGFRHSPIILFAFNAASHGNIDALTLLLVRHPIPTRVRMEILDILPMELDVALYEHLLPCHVGFDSSGAEEGQFLMRLSNASGKSSFLNAFEVFSVLCDAQSQNATHANKYHHLLDVFTNEADREHMARHYWEGADDQFSIDAASSREEVAQWYLKRAIEMHSYSGKVTVVKIVCEFGLVRLGALGVEVSNGENGRGSFVDTNSSQESEALGKLLYLFSAANFLTSILVDKVKDNLAYSASSIPTVLSAGREIFSTILEFCSMDLSQTVPFVLESCKNPSSNLSLFSKHLAQFSHGACRDPMSPGEASVPHGSNEWTLKLQRDMTDLCLYKIRTLRGFKSRKRKIQSSDHWGDISSSLQQALSMCSLCASFGLRDSTENRIIQNDDALIDFANDVFYETFGVVEEKCDAITEEIVDQLWSIFESLPFTDSVKESNGSRSSCSKVSALYYRLAVLHQCFKWRGQQSLPRDLKIFLRSRDVGLVGNTQYSFGMACYNAMDFMSVGFCKLISSQNIGHCHTGFGPMFDFISDVEELDRRLTGCSIQRSGIIGKLLLPQLLAHNSFAVLRDLLKTRPGWFNRQHAISTVLNFVQDAVAFDSSLNSDGRVRAALKCQDILGPLFPELDGDFEFNRRFLDALKFAQETMKLDPEVVLQLFSTECSSNPMIMIQTLMKMNPQTLLLGCEFWSNESTSSSACIDAATYFNVQITDALNKRPAGESSHVLPPMPGALVMQLANIVGIHSSYDLLVVKSCMASGALEISLASAAVSICFSMLCDAAFSQQQEDNDWSDRHGALVLNCVTTVLQSCSDLYIKKDLCILSLRLFHVSDYSQSEILLNTFSSAEYQLLALEAETSSCQTENVPEPHDVGSQNADFLVFKAAGLVAIQAKGMVNHSKHVAESHARKVSNADCGNMFIKRMLCEVKHSTSVDVTSLLSSFRSLLSDKVFFSLEGSSTAPNETHFEIISELILSWIVSEAFKSRTTPTPESLLSSNMAVAMELAASCVAEIPTNEAALLILTRCTETFHGLKQECRSSQSQCIQPDLSIVHRLSDRGYSWNACRRAAVMTNNESYTAALTWAVAHFQDDDFDSPLFNLRVEGAAQVDQNLINVTQRFLQYMKNRLEENKDQTIKSRVSMADNDGKANLHVPVQKQTNHMPNAFPSLNRDPSGDFISSTTPVAEGAALPILDTEDLSKPSVDSMRQNESGWDEESFFDEVDDAPVAEKEKTTLPVDSHPSTSPAPKPPKAQNLTAVNNTEINNSTSVQQEQSDTGLNEKTTKSSNPFFSSKSTIKAECAAAPPSTGRATSPKPQTEMNNAESGWEEDSLFDELDETPTAKTEEKPLPTSPHPVAPPLLSLPDTKCRAPANNLENGKSTKPSNPFFSNNSSVLTEKNAPEHLTESKNSAEPIVDGTTAGSGWEEDLLFGDNDETPAANNGKQLPPPKSQPVGPPASERQTTKRNSDNNVKTTHVAPVDQTAQTSKTGYVSNGKSTEPSNPFLRSDSPAKTEEVGAPPVRENEHLPKPAKVSATSPSSGWDEDSLFDEHDETSVVKQELEPISAAPAPSKPIVPPPPPQKPTKVQNGSKQTRPIKSNKPSLSLLDVEVDLSAEEKTELVSPLNTDQVISSRFISHIPRPSPPSLGTPLETPKNDRPHSHHLRPPNSGGGSVSSIEGSLSSRSSIKKQIQRGKIGTQKLSAAERKKLADEGKRLLAAARARNKKFSSPPSSIVASQHNQS